MTTAVSSIRRKPKITYKSPSPNIPSSLRIEGTAASIHKALALKTPPTPSTKPKDPQPATAHSSSSEADVDKPIPKKKYPMGPPLPLYHPLGRLALSLPELDPETFGLVSTATADEATRRSSGRARRPAAKVREATEDEPATSSAATSGTPAVADPAEKDKTSPAKKRRGGGAAGGTGPKRKRREPEDGDATYPAKRTRHPRGAAARDAISPAESADTPAPSTGEALEIKEKQPERRVTRARGAITRRDSTASEATVVSAAASVAPAPVAGAKGTEEDASGTVKASSEVEKMDVAPAEGRSEEIVEKDTQAVESNEAVMIPE